MDKQGNIRNRVLSDRNCFEAIEAVDNKRLLEMMAEFAAGVGHELNNPLAVISGYALSLIHI